MKVDGMPATLDVGQVKVCQVVGPVRTQQTTIQQVPGAGVHWVKWMKRFPAGAEETLTVCTLSIDALPADVAAGFKSWRAECRAAAAYLAALLDDRVAQEELFEDVICFDGSRPIRALDSRRLVRTFKPDYTWREIDPDALRAFDTVDDQRAAQGKAAARWYLQAAHAGPTAEGVVLMWTAIEALVPPPKGMKSRGPGGVVADVERAIEAAEPGVDLQQRFKPAVGELFGLRGHVLHRGTEDHALVRDGHYTLEEIARLLLRHHFQIQSSWPLRVPLVQTPSKTVWRHPPGTPVWQRRVGQLLGRYRGLAARLRHIPCAR
jgi:hypothetical protein